MKRKNCGAGNPARSPISAGFGRIRTRPRKFLSGASQPRLYGVLFYVRPNSIELGTRSHQAVVAFVLPKWSMVTEKKIGLMSSESFQRPQPRSCEHVRRSQKMNVIRHHDEGMELVTVECAFAVPQCGHQHFCNFRLPQEQRTGPAGVQQPVDRYEGLKRGDEPSRRKHPISGKTAVQPEGDEQGLPDYVPVGRPPFVMPHTSWWCFGGGEILGALSRLKRRLRARLPAPRLGFGSGGIA